jgi:hypothetical protein
MLNHHDQLRVSLFCSYRAKKRHTNPLAAMLPASGTLTTGGNTSQIGQKIHRTHAYTPALTPLPIGTPRAAPKTPRDRQPGKPESPHQATHGKLKEAGALVTRLLRGLFRRSAADSTGEISDCIYARRPASSVPRTQRCVEHARGSKRLKRLNRGRTRRCVRRPRRHPTLPA